MRNNKAALLATVVLLTANSTSADIYKDDKLKLYGDFRARLEQDWDSQKSSGSEREDRLRARIRARLGITYKPTDLFEFGMRLRSGSKDSQQSPHITVVDFDDNDTGDAHFRFDKWYLKAKGDNFWGWIGRNGLPFWKANEFFWDDDATSAGLAAGYQFKLSADSKLGINGGYFSLPVGMDGSCGNLGYGQAVLKTAVQHTALTAAVGLYDISGDQTDSDCGSLLKDNGSRDYNIWVANLQTKFTLHNRPLKMGVDFMHNSENYSLSDPGITVENQDQTDGWDAYISYGSTAKKGDWLLGYWYANIEQFAANSSYAQDDWMRWGSATQTRASNFKGHELRAAYGFGSDINLVARVYLVDAITDIEDGNRLRLDLNYKF